MVGILSWRAKPWSGEAFKCDRNLAVALLYSSLLTAVFIYAFVGAVLVAIRRILLGNIQRVRFLRLGGQAAPYPRHQNNHHIASHY